MTHVTLVVPRGAEAAAVRRARTATPVVEVAAGAQSARLPAFAGDMLPVVVGLCGALGELNVGDVVLYRSVSDARGTFACDERLAGAVRAHLVDACTTDHVVTTRDERAVLARRYRADVVDMEGAHLAAAFAAQNRPFAMIRVVSDDPRRDLPALGTAIRADGRIDVLRIAYAFARAPLAAFAFVRDVRRALRVLTQLARTLG
jgi:hypothetical protein